MLCSAKGELMQEEIKKELDAVEDTIFDDEKLNVTIDPGLIGGALRDRIAEIQNIQSRINSLSSKALFLQNKYTLRVEEAEDLATNSVSQDPEKSKAKAALKRYYIDNESVKLRDDLEETTLLLEKYKLAMYNYVSTRAKEKVKETNAAIDLGRSLLSWDKEEMSRMGG